jgi:hypothetical protein
MTYSVIVGLFAPWLHSNIKKFPEWWAHIKMGCDVAALL